MSWRHVLHQKGKKKKTLREEGRDEVNVTQGREGEGSEYHMPLYSVQEELRTGVKAKCSRPLITKYKNAEICLSGIISIVNNKGSIFGQTHFFIFFYFSQCFSHLVLLC